ncbi:MAG: flavodoxin family protein [Methanosarcinaceae archaeon]|nr:flavodoxin family protein [Methanosarcinaceae archaeon]
MVYTVFAQEGGFCIKVLGLVGSPNSNGNTAKLVKEILTGASDKGATTQLYNLAALKIKGCNACFRCQTEGKCATKDEMQQLYAAILDSEALVLGTPVYMWQMSAQTKLFVDRLMALMNPDFSSRLEKKKKLILAFTQGNSNPGSFMSYIEYTAGLFYFLGFEVQDTILASGTDQTEISEQPEVLVKARELGRELGTLSSKGSGKTLQIEK